MQFEDGYTSEQLAQTLDYVLRSQDAFLTPNLGRRGLLQIAAPAEGERTAARSVIKLARDHIESEELTHA